MGAILLLGMNGILFPYVLKEKGAQLVDAVKAKDWTFIRANTRDESFKILEDHFEPCLAVSFVLDGENRFVYYARFSNNAEIGSLIFELKGGMYAGFRFSRKASSFSFIGGYTAYPVHDTRLKIGDGEVHLKNGLLYRAHPMNSFYFFLGECGFSINPSNNEEQLTLRELTGMEGFRIVRKGAVLLLDENVPLLSGEGNPVSVDDVPPQIRELFSILAAEWGIDIDSLNEVWFPSFGTGLQAAFIPEDAGRDYFRYLYNPTQVPDTSLVKKPQNQFYLFYNAQLGMKISAPKGDEIDSLRIKMRFSPEYAFVSGAGEISFKEATDFKSWLMADSMMVKVHDRKPGSLLIRQENEAQILGEKLRTLQISYAGRLQGKDFREFLTRERTLGFGGRVHDRFIQLNADDLWYPAGKGQDFFKCSLAVSVPESLACLAPGVLKSRISKSGFIRSTFESPACKNLVLICGDFIKLLTVPGRIPVHFFGKRSLNLRKYLKTDEVRRIVDFLVERYVPLEIPELNVLLIRGDDYGGQSHPGLILFNLVEKEMEIKDNALVRRPRINSPVLFTDINRDNFVHEMSHQWWGGVISWDSFQEQWITEGLAQFSTLCYLEYSMSENGFQRVLNSARKSVLQHAHTGPMAYGVRLYNLFRNRDSFQSIVYNKAALVFMMLRDILGDQEFQNRLNRLVEENRYKNLSSFGFIKEFSQNSSVLQKFFNGWIYSRQIPEVRYTIESRANKVLLTVHQENTDFVFPLILQLKTTKGRRQQKVVIDKKDQVFELTETAVIMEADVDTLYAPIRLQANN